MASPEKPPVPWTGYLFPVASCVVGAAIWLGWVGPLFWIAVMGLFMLGGLLWVAQPERVLRRQARWTRWIAARGFAADADGVSEREVQQALAWLVLAARVSMIPGMAGFFFFVFGTSGWTTVAQIDASRPWIAVGGVIVAGAVAASVAGWLVAGFVGRWTMRARRLRRWLAVATIGGVAVMLPMSGLLAYALIRNTPVAAVELLYFGVPVVHVAYCGLPLALCSRALRVLEAADAAGEIALPSRIG